MKTFMKILKKSVENMVSDGCEDRISYIFLGSLNLLLNSEGTVTNLIIPRPLPTGEHVPGLGKVIISS